MFNGERLNASHLGSETRPRFLLSPILFNVVMEVLVSTVRQEKETKGMQIAKEELKLSLFADNMIMYTENPKELAKKILKLISELAASKDTKYTN